MNNESSNDEQLARSELRCGFLSVLKTLKNREAEIVTCEGNSVECKFIGVDRVVENVAVEDLVTPTQQVLPHAVVRMKDVDKIVLKS